MFLILKRSLKWSESVMLKFLELYRKHDSWCQLRVDRDFSTEFKIKLKHVLLKCVNKN
jgi:hypothetical protein